MRMAGAEQVKLPACLERGDDGLSGGGDGGSLVGGDGVEQGAHGLHVAGGAGIDEGVRRVRG